MTRRGAGAAVLPVRIAVAKSKVVIEISAISVGEKPFQDHFTFSFAFCYPFAETCYDQEGGALQSVNWRLALFGSFELGCPDGKAFRTKSSRLKVLVAYLAVQPGYRCSRRFLAENLFAADDVPTSSNLALLLTRAIAALGGHEGVPLLRATPDHVSLVEDLKVDVAEFEHRVVQARAESDSLVASRRWKEALLIAGQRPFGDLEHPLLEDAREHIRDMVLEALVGFTQSAVTDTDAELVLHRIKEFECDSASSTLAIERLMRIYAALGMKKELITAFTQFETQLDYEFGETAPRSLADLFEALVQQLDEPAPIVSGPAPIRPAATFGRDDLLRMLCDKLTPEHQAVRVITLMGQSGIGKSHLLRELYWQLGPIARIAYFDLETVSPEAVKKVLREGTIDFVLADHVQSDHRGMFAQLMRDNEGTRFVCASQARLGFAEEFLVPLGPLEAGQLDAPGPAVGMLMQSIGTVHSSEALRKPEPIHIEMAALCEGIPLALEIAGRLAGSIGIQATAASLRSNLGGLSSDRRKDRRSSLSGAIESSYRNLSPQAQVLVGLLSKMESRCHIDHLLSGSGVLPIDLEESILSGLVVRESNSSYVRVRTSTALVVEAVADPALLDSSWLSFCRSSRSWLEKRGSEVPLDLGIAPSLALIAQISTFLGERNETNEAIALFAAVRPWLGSLSVPSSVWAPVEELLMRPESSAFPEWATGITAIAAAHFHNNAFEKMSEIVEMAVASTAFAGLSADLRCQLKMQCGLAKRALNDFGAAIVLYQEAAAMTDSSISDATIAKCHYNLGALLEAEERIEEAVVVFETAADHFTSDTDPRVETLVNTAIGRLRYRMGGDMVSAGFILEATLAHARGRDDRRGMSEVLQNIGFICWERGLYLRSALAEVIGSLFFIEFGYNEHFRNLSKSSVVTLCASLFELGETELAMASRTLIDRLGDAPLYPMNRRIFDLIAEKTYHHPPHLKFRMATEFEVREHLGKCRDRLVTRCYAARENLDLVALLGDTSHLHPDRVGESVSSDSVARSSQSSVR